MNWEKISGQVRREVAVLRGKCVNLYLLLFLMCVVEIAIVMFTALFFQGSYMPLPGLLTAVPDGHHSHRRLLSIVTG